MNEKRKPGVLIWTTVAIVALLMLYPLSEGPVAWVEDRLFLNLLVSDQVATVIVDVHEVVYLPLHWVLGHSPEFVSDAYEWYFDLFSGPIFS